MNLSKLFKITIKKVPSPLTLKFWKNSTTRNKLKYILYTNKLFLADDVKTTVDDDGNRFTQIAIAPTVFFKYFKNEFGDTLLEITFNKINIAAIDTQLENLSNSLCSIFNAELMKINNQITTISYTIKTNESDYNLEYVLNPNPPKFQSDELQLSKYHSLKLNNSAGIGIFGVSGSGKSRLAYYIINQFLSITSQNLIFLCDPKNDELAYFGHNTLKIKNVYTSFEDIKSATEKVYLIMNERYEKRRLKPNIKFKRVLLCIDEYTSLKLSADKKEFTAFESLIKQIILKGRAANINLLIITQRPSADTLSGDIRDQLKLRILMGNVMNRQLLEMSFGSNDVQLTTKKTGQGYIYSEDLQNIENFTAPLIYFEHELNA